MGEMQDKRARLSRLIDDPEFVDNICASIVEGLSLTEVAHNYGVSFHSLMKFLRSDKLSSDKINQAVSDRNEWFVERVREEIKHIGTVDIRKLYDADGRLLNVQSWPDDVAKAVASVDVFEEFEGAGQERIHVGDVRKVKLWDKLKALEQLGKTLGMFTEKVEHSASSSLEALILAQGSKPDTK